MLDETHALDRRSWVESADGHRDFPIQNLPLGVFADAAGVRIGMAIGDQVLDLAALEETGLLGESAGGKRRPVFTGDALNDLLARGSGLRCDLRRRVANLLDADAADRRSWRDLVATCMAPRAEVEMRLPFRIGDYTDFYAGIHHARTVGTLFRPDNPLLPNYKYVPIGYHGRASTVRVSGAPVRRPAGQRRPDPDRPPRLEPSQSLDYELELGMWISGPAPDDAQVSPSAGAAQIAGYALLNDWSARDLQAWEYVPLGPFLAKSFHTTVSPWVITPEALAPFRSRQAARDANDPAPLPYLWDAEDQAEGALDIVLEVELSTSRSRAEGLEPFHVSRGTTRDLYWTPGQLVAHHQANGVRLQPGDLLGSGTISGPERSAYGSLIELTANGRDPLRLPNGETRAYLLAGDEVRLVGRAERSGFASLGFGDCVARVEDPATGAA